MVPSATVSRRNSRISLATALDAVMKRAVPLQGDIVCAKGAMRMKTWRLFAGLAVMMFAGAALSQSYPSKPIRLIVGFPPGGSADPTTRIIGAALSEQMGQPVVVENRPGADSALAAEQVTRLPADGYTLMFASNSGVVAPIALRKEPPYDPLTQLTPISLVGRATVFFYTHPSVPAKTLKEFIDFAKANPGKLNFGTGNPISILYTAQLMSATGIDMVHVPYKGEGPLNPDILTGRVHCSFLSTSTALSYGKEGKLLPLAVLLPRRSALMPDVPTIDEAGVPQVTVRQWAGVFGPPKMPREIVERLNKEVNAALKRKDVIDKLQGYGYAAEGSTSEGLLAINREDLALWKKLVREAKIPLE